MKPWTKAAVQGAACGLVLGMVLLTSGWVWKPQVAVAQAKQPAVPDVLRARRFEVVDAAGKTRIDLGVFPDGSPNVALFDAAGKARVRLYVRPDGSSGVAVVEAVLKAGATLDVSPDGIPGVFVTDVAGEARASLELSKEGSPSLRLRDKNGNLRAVVGSTKLETVKTADVTIRSESSLVLFDKDGKVIWKAP